MPLFWILQLQDESKFIKDDLTESDYGRYSITVSNHIGPNCTHDFRVVAECKFCLVNYIIKAIY